MKSLRLVAASSKHSRHAR